MAKTWIKDDGRCSEQELERKCKEIIDGSEQYLYIALYSDRFDSGRYDSASGTNGERLLEIRIFNENRELLFSRNSISEEFRWRFIVHDDSISQESYYTRYYLIDKNENESRNKLENGNLSILSTVGGRYSLPISEKEKRIKVITYVDYDDNGMAYAADYRVCGFEE